MRMVLLSLSSFGGDCGRGNGEDDGAGDDSLPVGGCGGDADSRLALFGDDVAIIGGNRSAWGRMDKAGGGDEDPERSGDDLDITEAGELGLEGRACLRRCVVRLGEVEDRRICELVMGSADRAVSPALPPSLFTATSRTSPPPPAPFTASNFLLSSSSNRRRLTSRPLSLPKARREIRRRKNTTHSLLISYPCGLILMN